MTGTEKIGLRDLMELSSDDFWAEEFKPTGIMEEFKLIETEETEWSDDDLSEDDLPDPERRLIWAYFKEAREKPLLTQEEEQNLARIIFSGQKKIRKMLLENPLTLRLIKRQKKHNSRWVRNEKSFWWRFFERGFLREIISYLEGKYQDDKRMCLRDLSEKLTEINQQIQEAKNKFVERNLRLAISIARKYRHQGLSFMDIIQEGNLGLIKAAVRFRPGYLVKGQPTRFSTYASWYVRQTIGLALSEKSRMIHVPAQPIEEICLLIRTQRNLSQELGRSATLEETARKLNKEPEKVIPLFLASQEPISLTNPLQEGNKRTLADLVQNNQLSPAEIVGKNLLREKARSMLERVNLDSREKIVMGLRFGEKGETLEAIGKILGISRERVRQIENEVFKRIKRQRKLESKRSSLKTFPKTD